MVEDWLVVDLALAWLAIGRIDRVIASPRGETSLRDVVVAFFYYRDTSPLSPLCPPGKMSHKVYEGSWKASKRHGWGVQQYGVGTDHVSSYSGEWQYNARHGQGTMHYATGNTYEGQWVKVRSLEFMIPSMLGL